MAWSQSKQEYVNNYLATHSCVDCGESDPIVLEFDHREPELKIDGIARCIRSMGIERLQEEISKCDVRCSNCHTRRHANG